MRYLVLLLLLNSVCFAQKNYLLIGTYTKGKSEGIYVYDFDNKSGKTNFVSSIKSSNPSFLTVVNNRFVYAVNENDTGGISAYRFNNGQLSFINAKPSGGKHPCYISSRTQFSTPTIIAGNYSSGNLIMYDTDSSGGLMNPIQTIQHTGSSVNPQRQTAPHVHATVVSPSGRHLYVPDLGTDKVMIYHFDPFSGQLITDKIKPSVSKPGSGPRHFCFHPEKPFAYLMEELSGTIKVHKVKGNGKLKKRQIISSHPEGFEGVIGSADIHISPNGKFLYASNRGDANNLAVFSINPKNGKLNALGHQPVLGIKPRNFNITPDGRFLLVANQESNQVVVFAVDAATGVLTDTGNRIEVPNPVCLVWAE